MKLYYSTTSPFARKVLICAMEQNLNKRLEMRVVHPLKDAEEVASVSPLGKVPALITDNDRLIVDSPVICEYLDRIAVSEGRQSLNDNVADTNDDAVLHALSDGIMDAAYLLVMETMRPDEQQSEYWKNRWQKAIDRTLDHLERSWGNAGGSSALSLGAIALGCALGYLDFRLDHLNWRNERAAISRWFAGVGERESFAQTAPQA